MTYDRPVLRGINLIVKDMDATVAFYRRLGLEVPDTDPAWQAHYRKAAMPDGLDLEFDSLSLLRSGTMAGGLEVQAERVLSVFVWGHERLLTSSIRN